MALNMAVSSKGNTIMIWGVSPITAPGTLWASLMGKPQNPNDQPRKANPRSSRLFELKWQFNLPLAVAFIIQPSSSVVGLESFPNTYIFWLAPTGLSCLKV